MSEWTDSPEVEEEAPPHDCTALQDEAFERGRLAGREEGRAECRAQVQEEWSRALRVAEQIGQVRIGGMEERERDIMEVALSIARKVLLRELQTDSELVIRQVRQVLRLLADKELVTIRVHPDDASCLQAVWDQLNADGGGRLNLCIEMHEAIEPGGCVVEQAGLLFDAQMARQLQTIAEEFGIQEIGSGDHGINDAAATS
jgi:flagellar assembly protein FliH